MPYIELLVELFEQRYVDLEFLVVVPDINKGPEEFVRENEFEGFPILLNRVEEPEEAEAQDLNFVLGLRVFSRILTLYIRYKLTDGLRSFWACLCGK